MTTTIKKTELLKEMRTVLKEYKNKTHVVLTNSCALCLLYYDRHTIFSTCSICPMYIFDKNDIDCMLRKCAPVYCYPHMKMPKRLSAVIEFYEESIKVIKSMTEEQLNVKDAFKFLIDIDNEVAKKYKL
jgi:hypothetical protein